MRRGHLGGPALAAGLGLLVAVLLPATALADVATIREATGANAAAIQATVDAFRADLGAPNNGNTVGEQAGGRREMTWDGADNDSAPARLPADFFNAIAPRGAILGGDPRIQFQQSADAANPTATPVEFGNVNATYPTAFDAFSTPRLFSALTSNVMDVRFFVAGTDVPAEVPGFGAVFTDVDGAGSTIEFFDRFGNEISERGVIPFGPGNASLSFTGVTFTGPDVASVRITSGQAALGPNDITQGGASDIVVMDDFIYGEPHAQPVPQLSFSSATYQVAESGGQATIAVERTGDLAATVNVGVSVADGSATSGSDYLSTGSSLTFAPGEAQKTFTIPVLDDTAVEPTETVNLVLDNVSSNGAREATIGANPTATLEIANSPDTIAPDFDLLISRRNLQIGRGTTFNIVLSEDAKVKFTLRPAATSGQKRTRKAVRFSINAKQGIKRFKFTGRVNGKPLPEGVYKLTAVATDAAGNESAKRRARIRITA